MRVKAYLKSHEGKFLPTPNMLNKVLQGCRIVVLLLFLDRYKKHIAMESCKCFHDVIMQFFAQNSGNSLNRDPSKISKISRTNTGRGLIILLYFVLDQQFSLCEGTLRSDILFKRLLKISIFHNRDIG